MTTLFAFGHPCEFQLKRACIGGTHCPLNGFPDNWCCSFVKGRINFKRDKPCEGARCRWGFEHPTTANFDAVNTVLTDARTLAQKLDDAAGTPDDIIQFKFSSAHYADTVHCTLQFLHTTPSVIGHKLGQLMACAALRSHDAAIFTRLLKTVKKPVDPYVLGAYEYVVHHIEQLKVKAAAGKRIKGEDVAEELRSDVVDVMNSALSQGGVLVDRVDQQDLQSVFVSALRTFPAKNRRKREMLEAALAKFSPKPAGEDARSVMEERRAQAAREAAQSGAVGQQGVPPSPSLSAAMPVGTAIGHGGTVGVSAVDASDSGADSDGDVGASSGAQHLSGSVGVGAAAAAAVAGIVGRVGTPPEAPEARSAAKAGATAGAAAANGTRAYVSVVATPPLPPTAAATTPPPQVQLPPPAETHAPAIGLCARLLASHDAPDVSYRCAFTPQKDGGLLDIAILGGLFALKPSLDALCGPAFSGVTRATSATTPPSLSNSPPPAPEERPAGPGASNYALFGPLDGFAGGVAGGGGAGAPAASPLVEGVLRAWGQQ